MKKIFIFILILLMCGCSKDTITTIVENNNNSVIAINYPTTNIKSLDKEIKSYVKNIYDSFKGEDYIDLEYSELNIDYEYFKVDNYINVILYTFINTSSLNHPINEIKTFVFDNNKNKIINLDELISINIFNNIIPIIKEKLILKYEDCLSLELLMAKIIPDFNNYRYFTINEKYLTFYFEPYEISSGNCNILSIDIPINNINLKLNGEVKNNIKYEKVFNKTIDPNGKVVAITFDDGPSKYTNEIIDLLNAYESNATFFVLGNKAEIYSDTIKKMVSYGNEIGNHSYNHKWLTKLSIEEFKLQIDKTQEIIHNITGIYPKYLRPTYGSLNSKIKNNTTLDIILWNVDSLDWKIKSSSKIVERVLKDVEDLDIILFHDIHARTLETIKIIIPKLIEEGYQLVTISELEEVKLLRKHL